MNRISIRKLIIRIAAIIAVTEFFIMLLLTTLPFSPGTLSEALIDVILLATISSPIIYFLVIKPFKHERDDAIHKLADMEYSDPLTGLPNRRVLLKCMDKSLAECARHNIHAALVLIDLDGFKSVNDNHGHDAGDAVLVEISHRLQNGIRKEDVVSRVGGDEFIILIKQLNDENNKAVNEAMDFAKKIQKLLAAPIKYKNKSIQLDASFGVHMLDAETQKIEAAIRNADIAMYHAKHKGKGHIVLYEPSMITL
jgi:two-component system cell cycle response regulator